MSGLDEKISALYDEVESEREVARKLSISRRQVRRALGRACDGEEKPELPSRGGVRQSYKEDGSGTVESVKGSRIKTLDQLLEACEVDLERYRVKRHVVNKWEVGASDGAGGVAVEELFQVKAWLEPNAEAIELRKLEEEILSRIVEHAPDYEPVDYPEGEGEAFCLEVCPFDLHLGKLAWGPEVHGQHYDTDIATEVLRQAVRDLLRRLGGINIERVVLPIGNDLLNADSLDNMTTSGTPMDVDSRHSKVFRRGWELMVEVIDRLRQVAPVDVLVVAGNHDEESMFKMGEVLWAWYRNDRSVSVNNEPRLRKFFEYGPASVMFTHGKSEKLQSLPMIMANENPHSFARTRHHEVHIGHFHKRAASYFVGADTVDGVVVRVLPSLCNTDEWHYRMGYMGSDRALEAYLWGEESGYSGCLSVTARPVEGEYESE